MTIKKIICISILFILPIVLIIVFDPASMFSVRNFLSDVAGTIFFIDVPIAICLLHYYCPQLFKKPENQHLLFNTMAAIIFRELGRYRLRNVSFNKVRLWSGEWLCRVLRLFFRLVIYLVYHDSDWHKLSDFSPNLKTGKKNKGEAIIASPIESRNYFKTDSKTFPSSG